MLTSPRLAATYLYLALGQLLTSYRFKRHKKTEKLKAYVAIVTWQGEEKIAVLVGHQYDIGRGTVRL